MRCRVLLVSFFCIVFVGRGDHIEDEEKTLPSKCHVCKHLVREMMDELDRSGKSREVYNTGQLFQQERKKIDYKHSEIRLTEALENACSNVLDYKVHKDKPRSLRYEKVDSVTFKTLKGLRNRGVKVDLGFPDVMWDSPDAEVTRLKNRCEFMVETFEEELEDWYWNHQSENLTEWLCMKKVLGPEQVDCFNETTPERMDDEADQENVNKEESGNVDGQEDDADKIRRLIREQSEGQPKGHENNRAVDEKNKPKTDKRKETKATLKDKGKKEKKETSKDDDGKTDGMESDSGRIQRLMREQSEEQPKSHKNKRGVGEKKNAKTDKPMKAKTTSKDKDKNKKNILVKEKINIDETDPDKIERLIQEQAEEQAERGGMNRRSFGGIEGSKRERLKRRLRDIDNPRRLRREIRKIRLEELDEDDYLPMEPSQDQMDSTPDDLRRNIRHQRYKRMDDLEELQHEIRMRAFEHDDFDDSDGFHLKELHHQFVEEAEDIRDPKELRKRIQDLDTLSAIFSRPGRRGHGHRTWRDEL